MCCAAFRFTPVLPFAQQLQGQLWGLLPGFHRLVFEEGRVMLTLCIGDAKAMLREQSFRSRLGLPRRFQPRAQARRFTGYLGPPHLQSRGALLQARHACGYLDGGAQRARCTGTVRLCREENAGHSAQTR